MSRTSLGSIDNWRSLHWVQGYAQGMANSSAKRMVVYRVKDADYYNITFESHRDRWKAPGVVFHEVVEPEPVNSQ
jgi:hypothetical protein